MILNTKKRNICKYFYFKISLKLEKMMFQKLSFKLEHAYNLRFYLKMLKCAFSSGCEFSESNR